MVKVFKKWGVHRMARRVLAMFFVLCTNLHFSLCIWFKKPKLSLTTPPVRNVQINPASLSEVKSYIRKIIEHEEKQN